MYTLILNSPSCKKTTISFTYRSNNYGTNHSSYLMGLSFAQQTTSCYQHFVSFVKQQPAEKKTVNGSLLFDLHHTGLSVQFATIEMGCLGHFMPETLGNVTIPSLQCTKRKC